MTDSYGRISFLAPSKSAGFFSNYFSVLSTMMVCLNKKFKPYVDASNTWFNPSCDFDNDFVADKDINPWDWWFAQDARPSSVQEVGMDRSMLTHDPLAFIKVQNLDAFRDIASEYCKIQPHILEEEEALYQAHIAGKKTLGILARGTENLIYHPKYPKVHADSWPDIIRSFLNKNQDIENIFLVSDDIRIISTITSSVPKVAYLNSFFRSSNQEEREFYNQTKPWWLSSPTSSDLDHRKRLGEECLIQTRLLARCDYFIGCYSGMNSAVHFFNGGKFKDSII
jgi:hypothetical protein